MRILTSGSDLRQKTRVRVPEKFDPRSIPGLKIWLDFSDNSRLTITSSPDIDRVTDKSSLAIPFSQATAARKPEIAASPVNARQVAVFDGIDDFLTVSSMPLTGNIGRVFAVCRIPILPSGNTNILAAGDENGTQSVALLRTERLAGINYFSVGAGATLANRVRMTTPIAADTTYIASAATDGAAFSLRLNGAAETPVVVVGANNGQWLSDFPLIDTLTVGWLDINTTAGLYRGLLGEVLYYDGVTLSAEQIRKVEAYLGAKWGVLLP